MSRIFVLDENSMIIAVTGKDERGNKNYASLMLVLEIINNGHTLAVNEKIKRKYSKKYKELEYVIHSDIIRSAICDLFFNKSRMKDFFGIETNLEKIKECDRPFVAVARHAKAILVTTDGKLDTALQEIGIKQEVELMRPEQANSIAQQPCN